MHVIRHHDRSLEIVLLLVVVQTTFQNDRSSTVRKNPSMIRRERNEVRLLINLQMRKLPSIKGLRHTKNMKTGRIMWGQPPSAVRRSEAPLGFDCRL